MCPAPTSCSLECWHSPWLRCWGRAKSAGFTRHGLCFHSRHSPYQSFSQILWDATSCIIKRLEQGPGPASHLCITAGVLSPGDQPFSKILLHRKATQIICLACLSIASTSEETLLITRQVMRSQSAHIFPHASLKMFSVLREPALYFHFLPLCHRQTHRAITAHRETVVRSVFSKPVLTSP